MDSPGYRVPANGSVDPRAVCHSRHHHTTDAESEGLVPGSTAPRRRRCSLARIVEDRSNGALDLLVRVERSFIVVENKANRESEVRLQEFKTGCACEPR